MLGTQMRIMGAPSGRVGWCGGGDEREREIVLVGGGRGEGGLRSLSDGPDTTNSRKGNSLNCFTPAGCLSMRPRKLWILSLQQQQQQKQLSSDPFDRTEDTQTHAEERSKR